MDQKTVLVSGASGNLGKAIVHHFLNQDHQVIGLVRQQKEPVSQHQNYHETEVDLLDEDAAEHSVKNLIGKYKTINQAVLTAGGFGMGNLSKTKIKDLQHQYQLNFETAYNLARPLNNHIKEQNEGYIFFIGSEPGMDISKGKSVVAYSLAKSLLFRLSELINAEKTNTKTYVVVPSTIDTPENRKSVPDTDFSTWQKPKDIAKIIDRYTQKPTDNQSVIMVTEELKNL